LAPDVLGYRKLNVSNDFIPSLPAVKETLVAAEGEA